MVLCFKVETYNLITSQENKSCTHTLIHHIAEHRISAFQISTFAGPLCLANSHTCGADPHVSWVSSLRIMRPGDVLLVLLWTFTSRARSLNIPFEGRTDTKLTEIIFRSTCWQSYYVNASLKWKISAKWHSPFVYLSRERMLTAFKNS